MNRIVQNTELDHKKKHTIQVKPFNSMHLQKHILFMVSK